MTRPGTGTRVVMRFMKRKEVENRGWVTPHWLRWWWRRKSEEAYEVSGKDLTSRIKSRCFKTMAFSNGLYQSLAQIESPFFDARPHRLNLTWPEHTRYVNKKRRHCSVIASIHDRQNQPPVPIFLTLALDSRSSMWLSAYYHQMKE